MSSTIFVHTLNGGKGKWSRYVLPFTVDAFAQLGDDLFIRHGDTISVVDEALAVDQVDGAGIPFDGLVQWGWLDCGQPGITKELEGFDVVGSGSPSVSIGYDQRNVAAFTEPYAIEADTVPGDIIPLPVVSPSLSVKLEFAGGTAWQLQSVTLYLRDRAVAT